MGVSPWKMLVVGSRYPLRRGPITPTPSPRTNDGPANDERTRGVTAAVHVDGSLADAAAAAVDRSGRGGGGGDTWTGRGSQLGGNFAEGARGAYLVP